MVNDFSPCSSYLLGHTAYSISDSGKLGVSSWDLEALARIIKMRVMPMGVNELSIGSINFIKDSTYILIPVSGRRQIIKMEI